jgi:sec-independent protein translocase protein TatB
VFNLQGSELIIILLLALVVLGPEKLPDAMRKAGKMYADLKKMANGFQDEFRSALDEPMREMNETANLLRDSADFTKLADGDRPEKPKSAEMGDAADMGLAPSDPAQVPVDDLPFGPDAAAPSGSEGFDDLPTPSPGSDEAAQPDSGSDQPSDRDG